MATASTATTLRTLDGLHLATTLVVPEVVTSHAVVLVHGGGVTRDEGGFFTRLAAGLAEVGITSLRYDLRGHGDSDGPMEQATLAAHLNDIRVALDFLRASTNGPSPSLLGTSFGGGLCAYYAAKRPDELRRLVLLNPQLNYLDRYVYQKPHWVEDHLDTAASRQLSQQGYLQHSPTVRHGRAFLNEVFWLNPFDVLHEISTPTLLVHGTQDTFVPVETSRQADALLRCEHQLIEIDGAQHGFAVHDDPEYANPQSQTWQTFVIRQVIDWLKVAA